MLPLVWRNAMAIQWNALTMGGLLMLLLSACDLAPRYVERTSEIDVFIARQAWSSACVGLRMEDEGLRRYTAERLVEYAHLPSVQGCLCDALYDTEEKEADMAVAAGIAGSERDDLATCLLPAFTESELELDERVELIRRVGALEAKAGYEALKEVALGDGPLEARAAAAAAMRPCGGCVGTLLQIAKGGDEGDLRRAAVEGLNGRKDDKVFRALRSIAGDDSDGGVRAAALEALGGDKNTGTDTLLCDALMGDDDERARAAAAAAMHGTKRKRLLQCLKKRLNEEEPSGSVREAALAALGASPSDYAADTLCESIGPFLRLHVRDKIADRIPGANIIEVQNNRDFERSYECVGKALRQGGYSCYARNHLGHWYKRLGGKASTPWCPGMPRN